MNLKHIEYVLTVLCEGSITGASKRLFISQPALSQTIKQIEQELGSAIFDRTTDPISLTYAGKKYVEAAQQILDIDRNMRADIAASRKEAHGRMRLGIPSQRELLLLPHVIPEFHKKYPYVSIDLIEHGSDTLERLTAEGQCDITLITTTPKPNKLNYVLIETEQVVLMASRATELAHRFEAGTPINITEAKNESFICLRPGHSVRVIQDKLFEQYHMTPNVLLETNNLEAAKHITSHSNAVMLCPDVYIRDSLDLQYRVQCHPIIGNDYARHFYLVYRQSLQLSNYMRDFVQIVCNKLGVPCNLPEA